MKLVIVESPYASTEKDTTKNQIERIHNLEYARKACLDALSRGESAWGSHLIWPQFLNDRVPDERALGISAGLAWSRVADYHAFYTDRGWSKGMLAALDHCIENQHPFRIRSLTEPRKMPPISWLNERLPTLHNFIGYIIEIYR